MLKHANFPEQTGRNSEFVQKRQPFRRFQSGSGRASGRTGIVRERMERPPGATGGHEIGGLARRAWSAPRRFDSSMLTIRDRHAACHGFQLRTANGMPRPRALRQWDKDHLTHKFPLLAARADQCEIRDRLTDTAAALRHKNKPTKPPMLPLPVVRDSQEIDVLRDEYHPKRGCPSKEFLISRVPSSWLVSTRIPRCLRESVITAGMWTST